MTFNNTFQQEVLALRELGREAALQNLGLAPLFTTPGRDADIERLLEGFAFLSARLREKLDDEVPEVTNELFNLLWPHYLRPLPAASIIQYQPAGNVTGMSTIPKGALVESLPVDDTLGIRCLFQTVYDTDILPLKVAGLRIIERNGLATIAVRFVLTSGNLRSLPLSRLRIFFTGDSDIPYTLYFNLLYKLKELDFVIKDGGHDGDFKENITATLLPGCITPVGFRVFEGLQPYSEETPLGVRILQEYFYFPEKFLFIDINGLEQGLGKETLERYGEHGEFELHFVLPALPENYSAFHVRHWQLFCTPVVNIFPFTGTPQKIDANAAEHKIIPDPQHPQHYSVYSVESVKLWGEHHKQGVAIEPQQFFNSLDHIFSQDPRPCYRLHIRPTLNRESVETFLKLTTPVTGDALFSIQMLCTNGQLPAQLGLGDICVNGGNSAGAVPFKNILPVSAAYPPPCSDDTLWKLLSNMTLNDITLNDVVALRAMLSTYAFRAAHDSNQARLLKKRLHSILSISSPSTDRIFAGTIRRGGQTAVLLEQDQFICEGEMYFFSAILNEFFSIYATQTSFHQLIVKDTTGREIYSWPARLGNIAR